MTAPKFSKFFGEDELRKRAQGHPDASCAELLKKMRSDGFRVNRERAERIVAVVRQNMAQELGDEEAKRRKNIARELLDLLVSRGADVSCVSSQGGLWVFTLKLPGEK